MQIEPIVTARLAIVATHPIQYNAPVFAELTRQVDCCTKVFYGWEGGTQANFDPGFGRSLQWDIPLLDGYDYEFVDNVSNDPGTHHYHGIDLPALEQRLLEWRPTAVLVYGWRFKAHLQIMRKLRGRIPILFRGDSTLLDERTGLRTGARRMVLRWVYRHVDIALYVGSANRDYFLKHGLREGQLVHAPHAVDNQRFQEFERGEAERLRQQLGVGPADLLILFVGKLERKKAPDQLIAAFRASGGGSHLALAGSGMMEDLLRKQSGTNLHFLGFQNQTQLPALYGAADLLALPSRGPGESWGLVLNEAMAAGCAVLASDRVGASPDLVRPGVNGWISRADNQSSLDDCLQQITGLARGRLKEMGQRSREIIQAWNIERQASSIAAATIRLAN